LAGGLYAQQNFATVTGIVRDASGSVIAGAAVTVRNVDTGIERSMQTSTDGNYAITNLAPGNYEITVRAQGFRAYVQQRIVLQVGDALRVDPRMEIGPLTESVTVDTQVTTLQTESGTIKGDVIVQGEIQELPLNDRDFLNLAVFVPGVVTNAEGGAGGPVAVGGVRASNTNFYVDGIDVRSPRGAFPQVRPNIDALQEFKMEVSGYSAEYGRMAGGVVNMALRSGTNKFHGNLNYFLRNDIFDARGFFDEDRGVFRRNQYAATVAGPIVKSKTFFMLSYDGLRGRDEQTRITRVPTQLERTGDFSQSLDRLGARLYLWDRLLSGSCTANVRTACFSNNTIPASRLSPIGLKIQDAYPMPNLVSGQTGFNYRTTADNENSSDSILGKIDHNIGNNFLAFRLQIGRTESVSPFLPATAGNTLGTFGQVLVNVSSMAGLDYTHVFSPTFLVQLRVGFSRSSSRYHGFFAGQNIAAELGLPNLISDGEARNNPNFLDWPQVGVTNFATLGGTSSPNEIVTTDPEWGAKATWVKSRHVLTFGYNFKRVQFNQPFLNNVRGTYNANGARTGHSLADLQLGWLQNATRRVYPSRSYWRQTYMGAFVNDDWKATPRLTFNLGSRWEVNEAPYDKYDRMGVFVREIGKVVLADDRNALPNGAQLLDQTGLRSYSTTARALGYPRSVVETDWLNFAPRAGFAYRATDRMVFRGGYGIFMGGDMLNPLRTRLSDQLPFTLNQTFSGVNTNPNLVSLQTPFPPSSATISGTTSTGGYERQAKQAYVQSWNITLEREIGWGTAIEMDYRGSKGSHLWRMFDYNQAFRNLASLIAGEAFQRPIPQWNVINFFSTGSDSIYNAFTASWRKRSRSGMFFRLNYSFSKGIDDASQADGSSSGGFAGALDSRNLRLDRGRSDWDRRHVFTSVGSYDLPFGPKRRWGSNWGGITGSVLGGWQLSGTLTAYSGAPLTVITSGADVNRGESLRPNRIRTGTLPANAAAGIKGVDFPWYDLSAFEQVPCYVADPSNVPSGCRSSQYGFQPFAFGNSGRNILDGPGLFSINLALSKNITIKEGRRLQLRLETFNALNRTNFVLTADVREFNSIAGARFSQVGNVGPGGGPRIFQYAIKYRF
jgi:hypothetical protein